MIWKSMPFSYSTMRQRWEKGQVVPEYRFIIIVKAFEVIETRHARLCV